MTTSKLELAESIALRYVRDAAQTAALLDEAEQVVEGLVGVCEGLEWGALTEAGRAKVEDARAFLTKLRKEKG
jgi:hypothetical protein